MNVNYGTKKIWSPDRSIEKKVNKLNEKIDKQNMKIRNTDNKISNKQQKVRESVKKHHTKHLQARRRHLDELLKYKSDLHKALDNFVLKKENLAKVFKKRADRDFRKQTIMTFRTLSNENCLKDFFLFLSKNLSRPVDIETALQLFFFRKAVLIETRDQLSYYFDNCSLSRKYQSILNHFIDGFNRFSLVFQKKKINVQCVEFT